MATTTGTYSILDLLQVKNASASDFGLSVINDTISRETAYANQTVSELLGDLCQPTVDQISVWGGNSKTAMNEVDEYGSALSNKQSVGINASVPLRRYVQKINWTSKYFQLKTPAEIAQEYMSLQKGYFAEVTKQVKKAIFNNVTYTFTDRLYNNVSLTVYPFINADGTTLPDSPAGATFDGSTHDHYDGEASFTATFVDNLVTDVVEHGNTKGLRIYTALADVTDWTGLSGSGFTPLPDSATQTLLTQLVSGQTANTSDYENKLIGYWKGSVEIWVKPWCIENYFVCAATGMPEKPLLHRTRPQSSLQGWHLNPVYEDYPLISETAEWEAGFAPFNRTMLAVLYSGNATYAVPTIS